MTQQTTFKYTPTILTALGIACALGAMKLMIWLFGRHDSLSEIGGVIVGLALLEVGYLAARGLIRWIGEIK